MKSSFTSASEDCAGYPWGLPERAGRHPHARASWSLELGAKKFHEQRTTGPLLFESAPAPPSAGFNLTFEDLTLYTAAGAPLIFARLTAVRTGAYIALELLSRRVTWGRVTLTSILARRRVGRGSGEGAGRPTNRPKRLKILIPPTPPPGRVVVIGRSIFIYSGLVG